MTMRMRIDKQIKMRAVIVHDDGSREVLHDGPIDHVALEVIRALQESGFKPYDSFRINSSGGEA